MQPLKATKYQWQKFEHLGGFDGLSDAQIAEHLALYAGYVRQVNTLNTELGALRAQGGPRAVTRSLPS